MKDDNTNGKATLLLWANTILTALILPLLAFIGIRLWDKVEINGKELMHLTTQLEIVRERQSRVLETLPKLMSADDLIQKQIDEHLKEIAKRSSVP